MIRRTLTARLTAAKARIEASVAIAAVAALAIFGAAPASALTAPTDMGITAGTTVAGGAVVNTTAQSVNSVTNMLMGPGLYIIMAIGAIVALYGFGRGQKESLFGGLGLFVLAAIIKGVFAVL